MLLQLIIIFSSAVVASFFLTPLARHLGMRIGLLDIPGELSIHSKPVPRTGGLAIFVAFAASLTLHGFMHDSFSLQDKFPILIIILLGALVGGIGLLGDMSVIPSRIEFGLQVIPALLLITSGIQVGFFPISLIGIPLTVFYLVGGACAMNLLDGMDGLAAGVAAIASIFFCIMGLAQGDDLIVILSVALMGSTLGFLYHNFPRARQQSGSPVGIFMGDVGSLFLGFMLATMAVLSASRPYDLKGFVVPLVILGIPILDTSLAITRRLLNNKAVISGDRSHFYDLLIGRGLSTRSTALVTYCLGTLLGLSALLMLHVSIEIVIFITSIVVIVLMIFAFRIGALKVSSHESISMP